MQYTVPSTDSGTMPERKAVGSRAIKKKQRLRQNIPWLLMFLPVIAYYVIFKYVPMGSGEVLGLACTISPCYSRTPLPSKRSGTH